MLNTLITSQAHLDAEIVAAKIKTGDFEVQVSPAFEINGETFRVVMDGHHSLAAAKEAGAEPVFVEMTEETNDRIALLNGGQIEDFLNACWMDGEYRYVATGKAVWE